jgi:hypothetical protein
VSAVEDRAQITTAPHVLIHSCSPINMVVIKRFNLLIKTTKARKHSHKLNNLPKKAIKSKTLIVNLGQDPKRIATNSYLKTLSHPLLEGLAK